MAAKARRARHLRAGAGTARHGFALLAIIAVLAVVAVLATVVAATMGADRDAGRIELVAEGLKRLAYEIGGEVPPTFANNVGRNPSRLSHLVTKISNLDNNSCGATYTSAQATGWRGPYHLTPLGAYVATSGYTIGTGFVANNLMVRNPATGTQTSTAVLSIVIPNVVRADAEALGVVVDGTRAGAGAGLRVRFGAGNPVTVTYDVEIVGC